MGVTARSRTRSDYVRTSAILWVLATLAASAAGCDRQPANDGGHPTTLRQFESDVANVLCGDEARPCCLMYAATYAGAQCRQLLSAYLDAVTLFASSAGTGNGATYNPDAAAACLAVLHGQVQKCNVDTSIFGFPDPAKTSGPCTVFMTGETAAGQACTQDAECAQPSGQLVTCKNGTCQGQREVGTGEPCPAGAICADLANDVCSPDSMTCGAPVGAGGHCDLPGDCGDEDCCVSGVCRHRAGQGEPCGGECKSSPVFGGCAPGLACINGTCTTAIRSGQSCDSTLLPCEGGGTCYSLQLASTVYVCQSARIPPACAY
jgi:hypothetical protein